MSKGPQQLPLREEVPVELTWDLTTIFKDDEAFETAFSELQAELPKVTAFKGKLNQGPEVFLEALEAVFSISRKLELLYVYSHLKMTKIQQIQHTKGYMVVRALCTHKSVKLFRGSNPNC